jgi:hypothetical protein
MLSEYSHRPVEGFSDDAGSLTTVLQEEGCMVRNILGIVAVVVGLTVAAQPAQAQFVLGYTDIGLTVGLGNVGDASLAPGIRFEKAIRDLPNYGNGVLGIMASAQYYSWSVPGYDWSIIPLGVTANYHFQLENNEKFDPFVGLGLGYEIVNCDYEGFSGDLCDDSALYFIGRVGARYFLNDKFAAYADAGAGGATVNVGVTLRLQ